MGGLHVRDPSGSQDGGPRHTWDPPADSSGSLWEFEGAGILQNRYGHGQTQRNTALSSVLCFIF